MEAEAPENTEDHADSSAPVTPGSEGPAVQLREVEFDYAPWGVFVLGLGAWALVFYDSVLR